MGHDQAVAAAVGLLTVVAATIWLAALLALVLALALTEMARRYALRRAMVDLPGPRRSHSLPTPRGGGIGIVAAVLLVVPWLTPPSLLPIWAGLLLVAAVGALDDHRPLPAWPRLLVHAAAAAVLAWTLSGGMSGGGMAAVLSFLVVFAIAVSAINIWNFMDGIDALAAGQASLILLALALWPGLLPHGSSWAGPSLVVAATCLGFLVFNLPPARLFLGDVGSGALGFALAVLLLGAVVDGDLHWASAALLPSAFTIDAGLTLVARVVRGEAWWRPHRQHLYQRAVRAGHGHGAVGLAYAAWTLAAVAIAAWSQARGGPWPAIALFSIHAVAAIIWGMLSNRFRERARRRSA